LKEAVACFAGNQSGNGFVIGNGVVGIHDSYQGKEAEPRERKKEEKARKLRGKRMCCGRLESD
jgi:hypothetical protein